MEYFRLTDRTTYIFIEYIFIAPIASNDSFYFQVQTDAKTGKPDVTTARYVPSWQINSRMLKAFKPLDKNDTGAQEFVKRCKEIIEAVKQHPDQLNFKN